VNFEGDALNVIKEVNSNPHFFRALVIWLKAFEMRWVFSEHILLPM
jgi:hypothetical protein